MAENTKAAKKVVDWDLIEVDYRAGIKSLRQMAEAYGVSHVAIKKKADLQGWTRDVAAKIQAKADEKVNKALVTSQVNAEKRAVTEAAVVEANADLQARIRLEHREDIGRARQLFKALLGELELVSTQEGQGLVQQLFELVVNKPDGDASKADINRYIRLQQELDKLLGMGGRVDNAKKLTEMLEKLVKLERQAVGIKDEESGAAGSYEDLLRRVAQQGAQGSDE